MRNRSPILAVCLLLALTGCTPLSGTRPAPVVPPPLGATTAPSAPVVSAGGTQPAEPFSASKFTETGLPVGAQSAPPGEPLAPPRPLAALPPGVVASDPHVRTDPTVYGGRLNLGPHEMAADRVVELTRYLETILAQNRELLGRVRELEALGAGREQALREVEAAQAEITKTRGTLASQKAEIAALQEKIRQLEREDIQTLKLVIASLEKMLVSPRREP